MFLNDPTTLHSVTWLNDLTGAAKLVAGKLDRKRSKKVKYPHCERSSASGQATCALTYACSMHQLQ
jgi:hypothetical protein